MLHKKGPPPSGYRGTVTAPVREFTAPTLQLLTHEGELRPTAEAEQYLPIIEALPDAALEQFYRDMAISRRIDVTGANMQRQGQLAHHQRRDIQKGGRGRIGGHRPGQRRKEHRGQEQQAHDHRGQAGPAPRLHA